MIGFQLTKCGNDTCALYYSMKIAELLSCAHASSMLLCISIRCIKWLKFVLPTGDDLKRSQYVLAFLFTSVWASMSCLIRSRSHTIPSDDWQSYLDLSEELCAISAYESSSIRDRAQILDRRNCCIQWVWKTTSRINISVCLKPSRTKRSTSWGWHVELLSIARGYSLSKRTGDNGRFPFASNARCRVATVAWNLWSGRKSGIQVCYTRKK